MWKKTQKIYKKKEKQTIDYWQHTYMKEEYMRRACEKPAMEAWQSLCREEIERRKMYKEIC